MKDSSLLGGLSAATYGGAYSTTSEAMSVLNQDTWACPRLFQMGLGGSMVVGVECGKDRKGVG